ncbi:MAG: hypothetical protein Q8N44_10910 [Rubrivivax sp.]|nr:hypothetical protein [Rubrivivax sp.]MDP3084184.1 hypothetical protein [Rubrivivax sp.]
MPSAPRSARALPALAAAALLATACSTAPVGPATRRIAFKSEVVFSEAAVKQGVVASRADCAAAAQALWVQSAEHGSECLRYWKAGFGAGATGRAIVFFHGDVWTGSAADAGYLRTTEAALQKSVDEWAAKLGRPYIFFARPGAFGSSGDHMQRRRRGESALISLALDQLKTQLGVDEWVLAGQSGGGHVTAALLAQRSDVVCAVAGSSVSSPRMRWVMRGWNRDSTGHADSYEPTEALVKAGKHAQLRVFVVGSVDDQNTPWAQQQLLTARARAVGIPALELTGEGLGPARHGMSGSTRQVAGWCAQGLSDEQILDQAKAGLRG